jgi:hypothetical protein
MTFNVSSSDSSLQDIEDVEVSPKTLRAVRSKAKRAGQTPAEYVKFLIERDIVADKTFSEITHKVSQDVRASGLTPEQLDEIVDRARKRYHAEKRRPAPKRRRQ